MTDTIAHLIDTVICGDVFDKLPEIPTGSVHCVVTSPPYWGLRRYGGWFMQTVWGSMKDFCPPRKHKERWLFRLKWRADEKGGLFSPNKKTWIGAYGLEATPELYIQHTVAIFREVWRVLRDDGTLWLNMGDSYASSQYGSGGGWAVNPKPYVNAPCQKRSLFKDPGYQHGLKTKDLCGIPWRVALALQADGWYLRQDVIEEVELYCPCGCGYILEERIWRYSQDREIIWKKPNPMPESVTDRCTKAHEYIFLMTKKPRYYYDADAIREQTGNEIDWQTFNSADGHTSPSGTLSEGVNAAFGSKKDSFTHPAGRNKRSVWTVPTCPYPEAHFATFPPDLILPCILASCPEWVCKKCGAPRRRILEKKPSTMNIRIRDAKQGVLDKKSGGKATGAEIETYGTEKMGASTTTGWTDCGCKAGFDGGIVLDPFMGSGTVAAVAYENNRHYIGIELNPDEKIQKRITDVLDKYALFETAITDR